MRLKIDSTTLLAYILPYLNNIPAESEAVLREAGRRTYAPSGDWWQLSTGEFLSLSTGDLTLITKGVAQEQITVWQYYALLDFKEWAADFASLIEKLTPPQTMEQMQVCKMLPKNTIQEALLIFNRNYFGLHNFAEAEKIPIFDVLIAKKDTYAKALFEHEWQRAQMRKYRSRQQHR